MTGKCNNNLKDVLSWEVKNINILKNMKIIDSVDYVYRNVVDIMTMVAELTN